MYKFLLCWRYLSTRYIALASIVSVMLGVATTIVVNGVMEGFSHELETRIHGILSDVVVEGHQIEGFHDPQRHMAHIRHVAGEYIAGMTPTVVVPAMMAHEVDGHYQTRQISLIGVDSTHGEVSDFGHYLWHPENRKALAFALQEGGYGGTLDRRGRKRQGGVDRAGWQHRRDWAKARQQVADKPAASAAAAEGGDPFRQHGGPAAPRFDPAKQQHTGIVMGVGLSKVPKVGGEMFLSLPGDDVKITLPTVGMPPKAVSRDFTIVDFYESGMNEYDSNFVFMPIEVLQRMRGMIDPETQVGNVTSIQIKLRNEADGTLVRDKLRAAFPPELYGVHTWRDKQVPMLAAVNMQRAVLNILLFLIIAVAGFGILAIFYMIVVEKTRDVGILKSLGAPNRGILGIFLSYGLLLGMVGSGVGMAIGLTIVAYINPVADVLAWATGHEVFDPTIYFFEEIPTIVRPLTVGWIVVGAMSIAVVASILPARRASRLHPVEALRYE
jgi:lipoprotein-releasing system permease protein